MKANVWAEKFQTTTDLFATIAEFAAESSELIKSRTAKSKLGFYQAAREGAIREIRQKWLAIQTRCPRLKPFGFEQIVKQIAA